MKFEVPLYRISDDHRDSDIAGEQKKRIHNQYRE